MVEAYVKADERKEAEQIADHYRQRFPQGRHRRDIDRWLKP
jgi:hypothetical protein